MRYCLSLLLFFQIVLSKAQDINPQEKFDKLFQQCWIASFSENLDSLEIKINQLSEIQSNHLQDSTNFYKKQIGKSMLLTNKSKAYEAFQILLKAKSYFKTQKDSSNLMAAIYQIAIATYYNGRPKKSKEYFKEALKFKKFMPKKIEFRIYKNFGAIDFEIAVTGKDTLSTREFDSIIDESTKFYLKAIKVCKEEKWTKELSHALATYASNYSIKNEHLKAFSMLKEARKYAENVSTERFLSFVDIKIAQSLTELKQYKKALKIVRKTIPITKKNKDKSLEIYALVVEKVALSGLKEYQKATVVGDSLYALTKRTYSLQLADKIAAFETKYKTQEKEKELLKAKAEKAQTQLHLNRQKQLTYSLIAGLALLILLGYSAYQQKRRKLEKEKQQAVIKEKEAGLKAIIQAEENERSKIARELHDGIVQQIGSVILNSRNILDKMNLLDKPESQELLKSLENSNQDIRNISHQMMPRALEELGLIEAVDDLLNSTLPLKNIQVNFEHFNITERLPQKIEKTLYRIVQELTNNIIKHSNATQVSVQLFQTNNHTMLIVEDNGVGIKQKNSKGIGLLNINSRLDMVNGTVNYAPSPQSGTLVTVKIPVK